jgi:hypothetical protein
MKVMFVWNIGDMSAYRNQGSLSGGDQNLPRGKVKNFSIHGSCLLLERYLPRRGA